MLIFASRTRMLDILQDFVSREEYTFYRLDGKTSQKERTQLCESYNNDNTFIFLISTGKIYTDIVIYNFCSKIHFFLQ
jgi:SNF2 family DNA or RNA helicase